MSLLVRPFKIMTNERITEYRAEVMLFMYIFCCVKLTFLDARENRVFFGQVKN